MQLGGDMANWLDKLVQDGDREEHRIERARALRFALIEPFGKFTAFPA